MDLKAPIKKFQWEIEQSWIEVKNHDPFTLSEHTLDLRTLKYRVSQNVHKFE